MKKFIQSIKKKPKAVRKQYAFYGAVLVTLFMTAVWLVSLPANFNVDEQKKVVEGSEDTRAPFSTLYSQAKNQFASLKEVIDALGAATSTSEVAATSSSSAPQASSSQRSLAELIESASSGSTTPVVRKKPGRTVLIGTTTASTSQPAVAE